MREEVTPVGAFIGRHTMAELEGIDAALLDNEDLLRKILAGSLTVAGATVLDITSKRFQPQGVTVLLLLAESHASIHTYPELGAAFVDVFTCGERADPGYATRLVAEALKPTTLNLHTVARGHTERIAAKNGDEPQTG
ncbi:adenosylmethionine decarboxylase [Nocardia sp. NPDC049190]|uniref:adenosylmethionine decarboxylase n=1 Tax=Nocardia sp. NPDC049190 TaxID=3155650 RepID=UPI0034083F31